MAQADPAQSLRVTNSRLKVDTGFGSNLIAEAYVENSSDKFAKDVTVTIEIIRRGHAFTTEVNLQYFFAERAASFFN